MEMAFRPLSSINYPKLIRFCLIFQQRNDIRKNLSLSLLAQRQDKKKGTKRFFEVRTESNSFDFYWIREKSKSTQQNGVCSIGEIESISL